MADPAPSKSKTGRLSSVQANDAPASVSQSAGDRDPTSTKQPVAGKPTVDGMTERFANTKLNIALINDPQNGPRFTMTKREAGLGDDKRDERRDARKKTGETRAPETTDIAAAAEPSPSHRAEEPSADQAKSTTEGAPSGERERPDSLTPVPALFSARAGRPSGMPPPATAPDKVPIDSAKTFVGVNGTYYDESWRWMDWRGTRQSWNWPAALSFGHWFAYRRLYGWATIHLFWFAILTAAIVNNIPVIALTLPIFALTGLTGIYGNTLYFLSFRRAVDRITEHGEGSYDERRCQLAAAGGTSPLSVGIMASLSFGSAICVVYVTLWLRGALRLNFWPFF
ncbi:MAG: hypothetical protein AAGA73_20475 [Pseudomonadota bacterium]